MANPRKKRPENAPGDFFVDDTCIDCGVCYWMSPRVFVEKSSQSIVAKQPATLEDEALSAEALVSCPVGAIGGHAKDAVRAFPKQYACNVFCCGYAARNTFGAMSWMI